MKVSLRPSCLTGRSIRCNLPYGLRGGLGKALPGAGIAGAKFRRQVQVAGPGVRDNLPVSTRDHDSASNRYFPRSSRRLFRATGTRLLQRPAS